VKLGLAMKISEALKIIKRFRKPANWYNLRSVQPVSSIFGLDRGTPIDRYYIEQFISKHSETITGSVLEIAESTYSKKFGHGNIQYEVLHYNNENPNATIIADLSNPLSLPESKIDCFICTQTFQFIYHFKEAVKGAHHLLKKNGVLLATMAGITQVSKYDMDRWGDYWRFTKLSALKSFAEVFGEQNVEVQAYGNVLSSISFLEGIAVEELAKEELDFVDDNYQMIIGVVARK
jgi:hypothetical protein